MSLPRLLFLSQTLPYPPDSGSKARTYQVLRSLSEAFEIDALCFYRRAEFESMSVADAAAELRRFGRIEAFPIPQEYRSIRLWRDHLASLVRRRVYTRFVFDSTPFGRRLTERLRSVSFDLAYADSLDLSGWFPAFGNLPLIVNHHDIQSALLTRRAATEPGVLRRWYLRHQSALMAEEERYWGRRVALNAVVSELDRTRLLESTPDARAVMVPNGVDVDYYRPAAGPEQGVTFVGASTWAPNRDAMTFFAARILPELRRQGQGAVRWIGRITEQDRRAIAEPAGIETPGHVPDTRPWLASAACCIAPIRMGGGTRVKILEAWAMGKAVVSTTIGCEGLAAIDGENLLIRDDPSEFAVAVHRILTDEAFRHRLGLAARLTVEREYDWRILGRKMNEAYRGLVIEKREAGPGINQGPPRR